MVGVGAGRPSERAMSAAPVLLYDGRCGFCARSVQFVLRHEGARRTLRFASLDGALAADVLGRHPELAGVDSVIWYEPARDRHAERLEVRSAGVLAVLRYLGGLWGALGALARLVPRPLRDAAYDVIARHRHRLGGAPVCVVPPPESRERVLDVDLVRREPAAR